MRFKVILSPVAGLLLLVVFLGSCKARKAPVKPVSDSTLTRSTSCPIPDSLVRSIRTGDTRFEWFSSRIHASMVAEKKSNSFAANLRIRRDSAIWMSITLPMGIEVARVLISRDSLRFLNRIDGTYFKGDYNYLKELLQTEVNFNMIQAVLLGNVYLHYQTENYVSDRDNGQCMLSTLRKRKIRRETELEIPEILTQEIWCSPDYRKTFKMEMQDYRPVRKFLVQYENYQDFEGSVLPQKMFVMASAAKTARIELEYSRLQIDKPLNLPFSIPDHYEPMR